MATPPSPSRDSRARSPQPPPQQQPSQEYVLLDYTERLDRFRQDRIAVHVHLSRLQSHNRREHHIRVAINTFEDLVKQFDGQIFKLSNNDIVFICKGARAEDISDAVLKLRYLFSEDPLTRFTDEQSDGGFCTWFFLEQDYGRFRSMVRRYYDVSRANELERTRARGATAEEARQERVPMTPALLAKLEEMLVSADLSALVRNQSICAVTQKDAPLPVFDEMYVSIGDLERTLMPNVSAAADPWLFQRLTEVLDKRMLTHVLRDTRNIDRAFSLNLNVATILSPEFQKFDQGIPIGVRGRLVIELQKVDIFHDMGAYFFARDFLRDRGYRICLDGMTHLTLPFIDRERLGLDLVKMYWSPELVEAVHPDAPNDVGGQIRAIGLARMILCRCDNEDAIRLGQQLGIALFQGRVVDQMLAAKRPLSQRQGSVRYK